MGNNKVSVGEKKAIKRVKKEIRNLKSPKLVKPRVFDMCYFPEQGKTYLEVKGKHKQVELIDFDDVVSQINEAKKEYIVFIIKNHLTL